MNTKSLVLALLLAAMLSLVLLNYSSIAQSQDSQADPDSTSVLDRESTSVLDPVINNESQNHEFKVFSLQHAEARQLTDSLSNLFSQADPFPVAFVFDERTNSVIARGPKSRLEILEALLMKLDKPASQPHPAPLAKGAEWEYSLVRSESSLGEFGRQGWEAYAVGLPPDFNGTFYYLKRRSK